MSTRIEDLEPITRALCREWLKKVEEMEMWMLVKIGFE